jgi:hypothetical protein
MDGAGHSLLMCVSSIKFRGIQFVTNINPRVFVQLQLLYLASLFFLDT